MGRENPVYEQRINGLNIDVQLLCRQLLSYAFSIGLDARVIQGKRTYEEQAALYAQGRTKFGRIVTYAKPGTSNHETGRAFDLGIFRIDQSYVDNNDVLLKVLLPYARKIGLSCGGDWTRPDYPHFEKVK